MKKATNLQALIVGIFFSFVITASLATLLWIRPFSCKNPTFVKLFCSNVENISTGTNIQFSGKNIGIVSSIKMNQSFRSMEKNESSAYPFVLTLKINPLIPIHNSDLFSISSQGLLGDKFISIEPKTSNKGILISTIPDFHAYAYEFNTLKALNQLLAESSKQVENLSKIFTNENSASKVIEEFKNIASKVDKALDILSNSELVDIAKDTIINLNSVLNNIQDTIKPLQEKKLAESIVNFVDKIESENNLFNTLFQENPVFPNLCDTVSSISEIANTIKEYGILFQYNKQWKKDRVCKKIVKNIPLKPLKSNDKIEIILNPETEDSNSITTDTTNEIVIE